MILSADPSLLGLGFGVIGTVDALNIDRAFFAAFPRFRLCVPSRAPPGWCILGWARCELPEPDEP
jgi:hypothetical protein